MLFKVAESLRWRTKHFDKRDTKMKIFKFWCASWHEHIHVPLYEYGRRPMTAALDEEQGILHVLGTEYKFKGMAVGHQGKCVVIEAFAPYTIHGVYVRFYTRIPTEGVSEKDALRIARLELGRSTGDHDIPSWMFGE